MRRGTISTVVVLGFIALVVLIQRSCQKDEPQPEQKKPQSVLEKIDNRNLVEMEGEKAILRIDYDEVFPVRESNKVICHVRKEATWTLSESDRETLKDCVLALSKESVFVLEQPQWKVKDNGDMMATFTVAGRREKAEHIVWITFYHGTVTLNCSNTPSKVLRDRVAPTLIRVLQLRWKENLGWPLKADAVEWQCPHRDDTRSWYFNYR